MLAEFLHRDIFAKLALGETPGLICIVTRLFINKKVVLRGLI
jgi:hypothetical protein